MMILVTGAAGKTGRAVVQALVARGVQVRGWVRRPEQAAILYEAGAAEVAVGDIADQSVYAGALAGVAAVYHICPNMHPDEVKIGRWLVAAARAAGVSHIVYHSVLHPQTEGMPHHWNKLRVEELLLESGIPTTIVQPTAYMQNLLAGWRRIVDEGVYAVPYPAGTRLSLVDLEDVAVAVARVLTEPGLAGGTYELVGTVGLTQTAVTQTLATHLNRPVQFLEIPLNEWQAGAEAAGLSPYAIDTLRRMFVYYASYGLVGNPFMLRQLLGREPASLAEFFAVQEALAANSGV
ncbi:MAG: NmrA family NAD(P)-binding protein [Anaerolineales bacterium]|nr:NmrA family NAD(P)-binding protein [Anaerolineales bacterium]